MDEGGSGYELGSGEDELARLELQDTALAPADRRTARELGGIRSSHSAQRMGNDRLTGCNVRYCSPKLATVARHIVIDERRRKPSRPAKIGDGGAEKASAADATVHPPSKEAVARALQALSAAHREVLNETVLRGCTVNEAAEALGIPVGTVKSRVYYALRALRLVMAEYGLTHQPYRPDTQARADRAVLRAGYGRTKR